LFTQKALAILIGAEGIGLVGNFRNVINFFEQFSILGTFNGLVKYFSEFKENRSETNKLLSTSLVFSIFASLISFLVLFFGSHPLNEIIFGVHRDFSIVFKILAFIIPFMSLNAVFNGLLNGLSDYKTSSKLNSITIISGAVLLILLTIWYSVKGSIIALSFVPVLQFITAVFFIHKKYKSYINFKKLSLNLFYKNRLLSYSIMTLIVVLSVNAADVAIRRLIEDTIGPDDAGYWTAMTSISKSYMQFTAAIFPLYILPKYAAIKTSFEFRHEVLNIFKLLLPVFTIGIILIFIFRDIIIQLLYTKDFMSMSVLFKWQLLGDLVKLSALIISYQFLAKRKIGYFIFTELLSVLLFYAFSKGFIQNYGTEGVVLAHCTRYVIYFLVVLFILRHNFIGKNRAL
jgi:PST family polysaccharide transporter